MRGDRDLSREEIREALILCENLHTWAADLLNSSRLSGQNPDMRAMFKQILGIMKCSRQELAALSLIADSASDAIHLALDQSLLQGLDDTLGTTHPGH